MNGAQIAMSGSFHHASISPVARVLRMNLIVCGSIGEGWQIMVSASVYRGVELC